jgi:putative ABC transport system permease protein
MRLVTLVYKNVSRRRIRSALTVSGMAVAVAAVVALVGIADGFQRSFLDLYQGHGVDIVVVRARVADRMTSDLDQSIGTRIAAIEGVDTVDPVLLDAISLEDSGLYGVVVQGLEPDNRFVRDQTLVEGRAFTPSDGRAVMLGQILARNLDKHAGDRVEIYQDEYFNVVGVYDRHNIFENGAMIVPLSQLQDLLGQRGQVTAFNVTLRKPKDAATIARVVGAIEGLGLGVSAMATEEYVATDAKIQGVTAMAWSTSAIALVIGAIGMLNTMIVSVFERTSEIGILRAIGWRKSRIVRMILMESGLLSVAGAVFGTLLALLLTYVLSRVPAASGMVGARIAPQVVTQGFLIALLIGLLGALYPAYRAARLLPTVALRNEG